MERVIILNDFGFVNGGAAKVAINSAIQLSEKGYKVSYFCAVAPVDNELKNSVDEVICLNQHEILNNPSRIKAVIDGIWNRKAHKELCNLLDRYSNEHVIVHIHGWSKALSVSVVSACMRRRIKCVITLHDYFSVCPNGGFYNYRKQDICTCRPMSLKCISCNCDSRNYAQKCWRVLRQFVQDRFIRYNKSIALIYLSEFSINKMFKYLKTDEYYFVPNPISSFDIKCNPAEGEYYLYAGRISPEKGVDLFCQAITELGHSGVVIGDGVSRVELQEKYPNISFEGWKSKSEMIPYIAKAKALIFPSKWYEVSPLTIPEFIECGIPCVVPDKCAASEEIEKDVNGVIFKTGNVKSLQDAIQEVSSLSFSSKANDNNKCLTHIDALIEVYQKIEKQFSQRAD